MFETARKLNINEFHTCCDPGVKNINRRFKLYNNDSALFQHVLLLLLLLLLKVVVKARLGENDFHHISSKTPSP